MQSPAPDAAAVREHFEERAAILQFDAGMSRDGAEAAARQEVARLYGGQAVLTLTKENP